MIKTIISLLVIITIISGCAMSSSQRTAITPVKIIPVIDDLSVDIWLDCGEHKLGAYTIELGYNPDIIQVSEIKTAGENSFPGTPMSNPATFKSGKTVIIGMYTGKDISNGRIKIAHIVFLPVSSGTSPLSVILQSAYDTGGNPFQASAGISTDSLTVTK